MLLSIISIISLTTVSGTDTGWKSPTGEGDTYSGWPDATNAYVSDNNDADPVADYHQDYYGFNLYIPSDATIDGIVVSVEATKPGTHPPLDDLTIDCRLTWNDFADQTVKKTQTWNDMILDEYREFGGSSDTWGRTWSPNDFSNSNFRVHFHSLSSGSVDHVRVKVYYSQPPADQIPDTTMDDIPDPAGSGDLATITGGSTDDNMVNGVYIQVYNKTDKCYWNGDFWFPVEISSAWIETNAVDGAFDENNEDWIWIPTNNWVDGKNYVVKAKAVDNNGQPDLSPASDTFFYYDPNNPPDTTMEDIPETAVSSDVEQFTGAALDSDGTISSVQLFIFNDTDGKGWAGYGWQSGVYSLDTAAVDGIFDESHEDWIYDCVSAGVNWVDGKQYTVEAYAWDNDMLYDPTPATDTFTYSDPNNPPDTTMDDIPDPADSSDVSTITGSASDTDGTISMVRLLIHNDTDLTGWTPSGWQDVTAYLDATPDDGSFNEANEDWTYDCSSAGVTWADGKQYTIVVLSLDDDLDFDPTPVGDTFTYSIPPPVNNAPTAQYYTGADSMQYAGKQYSFTTRHTDPDGASDIGHAYAAIGTSSTDLQFRCDPNAGSNPTVTVTYGSSYLIGGSATAARSSTTNGWDITWTYTVDWDWTHDDLNNIDYYAYTKDNDGLDSGWQQSNQNADYENDIIVKSVSFTLDDSAYSEDENTILTEDEWFRGGVQVKATGVICYEGATSTYPSNDACDVRLFANSISTSCVDTSLGNSGEFDTGFYQTTSSSGTDNDYDFKVQLENIPSGGLEGSGGADKDINSARDNQAPSVITASWSESSSYLHIKSNTLYFSDLISGTVTATLSGTSTDDGVGLEKATFSTESSLASSPQDDLTPSAWSGDYGIAMASKDTASPAIVTLYDKVGNTVSVNFEYIEDTIGPNTPSHVLCSPDAFGTGGEYDDDNTIYVNWSGEGDSGSGVDDYYMEWNDNTPEEEPSGKDQKDTDNNEGGDGTWKFYVRGKDNVGNWGSAAYDSITIDITNPSCIIQYDNTETIFKEGESLRIYAVFNEAGSNMDESSIKIEIDTQGNGDLGQTTMIKSDNTHWYYDWTIPTGTDENGPFTVKIYGKDNAGKTLSPNPTTDNSKQIDNSVQIPDKLSITAPSSVTEENSFQIIIKSENNPINNVKIKLNGGEYYTDINGIVILTAPTVDGDTYYTINAEKTGYNSDSVQIQVLNIVKYGYIIGNVTDNNSKPIENALVCLLKGEDTKSYRCDYSDENGEYNITTEIGIYAAVASKEGYNSDIKTVEIIENYELVVNFRLIKNTTQESQVSSTDQEILFNYMIEDTSQEETAGAKIDVEENEIIILSEGLNANIQESELENAVTFKVNGPDGTYNKIIFVKATSKTLANVEDINSIHVRYDEEEIIRATLDSILNNAYSTESEPAWAVINSVDNNNEVTYYFSILVPSFSEHTIDIYAIKPIVPEVLGGVMAVIYNIIFILLIGLLIAGITVVRIRY
jgi:hypothetical protein